MATEQDQCWSSLQRRLRQLPLLRWLCPPKSQRQHTASLHTRRGLSGNRLVSSNLVMLSPTFKFIVFLSPPPVKWISCAAFIFFLCLLPSRRLTPLGHLCMYVIILTLASDASRALHSTSNPLHASLAPHIDINLLFF